MKVYDSMFRSANDIVVAHSYRMLTSTEKFIIFQNQKVQIQDCGNDYGIIVKYSTK